MNNLWQNLFAQKRRMLLGTVTTLFIFFQFFLYHGHVGSWEKTNQNVGSVLTAPVPESVGVDRIIYFNSVANPIRRHYMESWLKEQSIPYQRIEPISPARANCETSDCNYRVGVMLSYLHMIHNCYVDVKEGSYLVLQDDTISISNLVDLAIALQEVPGTWDVVRLDCTYADGQTASNRKWFRQDHIKSCYHSNAMLWRQGSLQKLKDLIVYRGNMLKAAPDVKEGNYDLDCMLASQPFETYCINVGITHSKPSSEPENHVVENAWLLSEYFTREPLEKIQKQSELKPLAHPNQDVTIDRIYYLNLPKNKLRSQSMEIWLKEQPIPHKRIIAIAGEDNSCTERHNNTIRCKGIAGINKSLVRLIEEEETTGITLILEDDIVPIDRNLKRFFEALKIVPNDWDIIRFDCWGISDFSFRWVNELVIDTTQYWKAARCKQEGVSCIDKLYGGAYVMLWRGTSVHKLKEIWSQQPYDDADGRIAGRKKKNITSYCVNIGMWDHLYIQNSYSDASLLDA